MTPSMRVAGVTSKHGFHTCQEQTKDKPKDEIKVKVCTMAAGGLYLESYACKEYLITSLICSAAVIQLVVASVVVC